MRKYFDVLNGCSLFNNIEDKNLFAMLNCFGAEIRTFQKNQTIIYEGEKAVWIGIMLSGTAQLIRIDYYGNRSILTKIETSQIFGESFVCAELELVPVHVVATENCEVMMIDGRKIMRPCCNNCEFHSRVIFNMMKIMAIKNLIFHQKIEIVSKRTTREKLMTYLLLQAKQNGKNSFNIPYDRQELADFLEVDRSGLSSEISKLRRENIIECKRNFFRLL